MDNEVLTILRGLVKGCRGMGNSAYRAHGIDRDTKNDYILSLQECKVRGKERHLTTPQVSESNIGFIRYLGVQARNLRMKGALLISKRNNSGWKSTSDRVHEKLFACVRRKAQRDLNKAIIGLAGNWRRESQVQ